MKYVAVGAS